MKRKLIVIVIIVAMAQHPAADASDALRPRAAGEREGAGEEFDIGQLRERCEGLVNDIRYGGLTEILWFKTLNELRQMRELFGEHPQETREVLGDAISGLLAVARDGRSEAVRQAAMDLANELIPLSDTPVFEQDILGLLSPQSARGALPSLSGELTRTAIDCAGNIPRPSDDFLDKAPELLLAALRDTDDELIHLAVVQALGRLGSSGPRVSAPPLLVSFDRLADIVEDPHYISFVDGPLASPCPCAVRVHKEAIDELANVFSSASACLADRLRAGDIQPGREPIYPVSMICLRYKTAAGLLCSIIANDTEETLYQDLNDRLIAQEAAAKALQKIMRSHSALGTAVAAAEPERDRYDMAAARAETGNFIAYVLYRPSGDALEPADRIKAALIPILIDMNDRRFLRPGQLYEWLFSDDDALIEQAARAILACNDTKYAPILRQAFDNNRGSAPATKLDEAMREAFKDFPDAGRPGTVLEYREELYPLAQPQTPIHIGQLGLKVDRYFGALGQNTDAAQAVKAAQALGSLREFRTHKAATRSLWRSTVNGLCIKLRERGRPRVKAAIAAALCELAEVDALGVTAEEILANSITAKVRQPVRTYQIRLRLGICRGIQRMRNYNYSPDFPVKASQGIFASMCDIQDDGFSCAAVGTIAALGLFRQNPDSYAGVCYVLRQIIESRQMLTIAEGGGSPTSILRRPFSGRTQEEAIARAAHLCKIQRARMMRRLRDVGPQRVLCQDRPFCDVFLSLVEPGAANFSASPAVRTAAAQALQAVIRGHFKSLGILEKRQIDLPESLERQMEMDKDELRLVLDRVFDRQNSELDIDTKVKAALINSIAEVNTSETVDTGKFYDYVLSTDGRLAEAAAMAIAKFDQPGVAAPLRDFYEAHRRVEQPPPLIRLLEKVFEQYPEAGKKGPVPPTLGSQQANDASLGSVLRPKSAFDRASAVRPQPTREEIRAKVETFIFSSLGPAYFIPWEEWCELYNALYRLFADCANSAAANRYPDMWAKLEELPPRAHIIIRTRFPPGEESRASLLKRFFFAQLMAEKPKLFIPMLQQLKYYRCYMEAKVLLDVHGIMYPDDIMPAEATGLASEMEGNLDSARPVHRAYGVPLEDGRYFITQAEADEWLRSEYIMPGNHQRLLAEIKDLVAPVKRRRSKEEHDAALSFLPQEIASNILYRLEEVSIDELTDALSALEEEFAADRRGDPGLLWRFWNRTHLGRRLAGYIMPKKGRRPIYSGPNYKPGHAETFCGPRPAPGRQPTKPKRGKKAQDSSVLRPAALAEKMRQSQPREMLRRADPNDGLSREQMWGEPGPDAQPIWQEGDEYDQQVRDMRAISPPFVEVITDIKVWKRLLRALGYKENEYLIGQVVDMAAAATGVWAQAIHYEYTPADLQRVYEVYTRIPPQNLFKIFVYCNFDAVIFHEKLHVIMCMRALKAGKLHKHRDDPLFNGTEAEDVSALLEIVRKYPGAYSAFAGLERALRNYPGASDLSQELFAWLCTLAPDKYPGFIERPAAEPGSEEDDYWGNYFDSRNRTAAAMLGPAQWFITSIRPYPEITQFLQEYYAELQGFSYRYAPFVGPLHSNAAARIPIPRTFKLEQTAALESVLRPRAADERDNGADDVIFLHMRQQDYRQIRSDIVRSAYLSVQDARALIFSTIRHLTRRFPAMRFETVPTPYRKVGLYSRIVPIACTENGRRKQLMLEIPVCIAPFAMEAVRNDAVCFAYYHNIGRGLFVPEDFAYVEEEFYDGMDDKLINVPVSVHQYFSDYDELNFRDGALWRWAMETPDSESSRLSPEETGDVLADICAAIVYHYESEYDGGRTIAGLSIAAGDIIMGKPPHSRREDGSPNIKLITIRRRQGGMDVPRLVRALIGLEAQEELLAGQNMRSRETGTYAEVWVRVSNVDIAFEGIMRGLRYLYRDQGIHNYNQRAKAEALRWVRQFTESEAGRPYREKIKEWEKRNAATWGDGRAVIAFGNTAGEGQPDRRVLESQCIKLQERLSQRSKEAPVTDDSLQDGIKRTSENLAYAQARLAKLQDREGSARHAANFPQTARRIGRHRRSYRKWFLYLQAMLEQMKSVKPDEREKALQELLSWQESRTRKYRFGAIKNLPVPMIIGHLDAPVLYPRYENEIMRFFLRLPDRSLMAAVRYLVYVSSTPKPVKNPAAKVSDDVLCRRLLKDLTQQARAMSDSSRFDLIVRTIRGLDNPARVSVPVRTMAAKILDDISARQDPDGLSCSVLRPRAAGERRHR